MTPSARHRDQSGGVSAEWIAAAVIVAALIAALFAAGFPRAAGDWAEHASCQLFNAERCDQPDGGAFAGSDGDGSLTDGDRSLTDGDRSLTDGDWPLAEGGAPSNPTTPAAPDDEHLLDPTGPIRDRLPDPREGARNIAEMFGLEPSTPRDWRDRARDRLTDLWEGTERWVRDSVVDRIDEFFNPPARRIEDAETGETRRAGDPPTGNVELDAVYDAAEAFSDYLADRFDHHGLDGRGHPLIGVVNDDPADTPNAKWSRGRERTFYSQGWAVESIIIHEFGHGVVYYLTGGIDTSTVEGHALNEALADIFSMNVTGVGTIGHDLPGRSDPIRVPEDPSQLDHPAHTSEYDEALGGHANSTVISHAYYLAAEDVGQDAAEQTLYRALDRHVPGDAGFETFRSAMLTAAEELYGRDSDEWEGIHQAFDDVGLDGTWTP